MKNLSIYIAIVIVIISVLLPFILPDNNTEMFSYKLLTSLGSLVAIVGTVMSLILWFSKKKYKNRYSVFIQGNLNCFELIFKLKSILVQENYICYTELSSILLGQSQKNQNINELWKKSNLLVIILSDDNANLYFLNLAVKYYKKNHKPVQVYSFIDFDRIPIFLKSYPIVPLPEDKKEALNIILRFINGFFLLRKIKN